MSKTPYNVPHDPEFQQDFMLLYSLARKNEVDFSLNFYDGENNWSVQVGDFETRDHSLSIAIELALGHLSGGAL